MRKVRKGQAAKNRKGKAVNNDCKIPSSNRRNKNFNIKKEPAERI
jgi:hypothetical protein